MHSALRRPFVIGLIAAVLGGLYFLSWVSWIPTPTPATHPAGGNYGFATTYEPPTRAIEVAANGGDGQAFAALAMDPGLARPEVFKWGEGEMAYRASRPLAAYAAWALSGGQPDAVPWALGLVTVIGVGVFAGATAALARHLGRDPLLALLVVVAPGVVIDLRWMCPDVLAAGLAIAGLVSWMRRPGRPWLAVALFTLAVLTRETVILVPIAIGVDGLIRRTPLRHLLPLAVVPAALAVWLAVVHARVGAWPTEAEMGTRLSLPFAGMVDGLSTAGTGTVLTIVATFALGLLGYLRCRDVLVRRVLLAQFALAAVMGDSVWTTWVGVGRLMLPMVGVALAAALPAAPARAPAGERDDPGVDRVPTGATAG